MTEPYTRIKGTTTVYKYRNGKLEVYAMTGNIHTADYIVLALNELDQRRRAGQRKSA